MLKRGEHIKLRLQNKAKQPLPPVNELENTPPSADTEYTNSSDDFDSSDDEYTDIETTDTEPTTETTDTEPNSETNTEPVPVIPVPITDSNNTESVPTTDSTEPFSTTNSTEPVPTTNHSEPMSTNPPVIASSDTNITPEPVEDQNGGNSLESKKNKNTTTVNELPPEPPALSEADKTVQATDDFVIDISTNTITIKRESDEGFITALKQVRKVAFGDGMKSSRKRKILLKLFKNIQKHVSPLANSAIIASYIAEKIQKLESSEKNILKSCLEYYNDNVIAKLLSDQSFHALNLSYNPKEWNPDGIEARRWVNTPSASSFPIVIDSSLGDKSECLRLIEKLKEIMKFNTRIRRQPFFEMDLKGPEYARYLIMVHTLYFSGGPIYKDDRPKLFYWL